MSRFRVLDDVEVPDQWDEILRRSERPGTAERRAFERHRRRPVLAAAACALLIAAAAVLARAVAGGGGDDVSADRPREAAAPGAPPALRCLDGGLAAGSVPRSATPAPLSTDEELREGQQVLSWREGAIELELLVPGRPYIDFVGERTEQIGPTGLMLLQQDATHLLDETGFVGSCDGYELTAVGGTEAERRELLLRVADGLRWEPSLGVTDCGPLSPHRLAVVEGPTAAAVFGPLELAGVDIGAETFEALSRAVRLPDGPCQINAVIADGLRVAVIVSGRDGTYAVDQVAGFQRPDQAGTVDLDTPGPWTDPAASYSARLDGTTYTVRLEYWCSTEPQGQGSGSGPDRCADASLTIRYPQDDIAASTSIDEPSDFVVALPAAPTPGTYGVQAITYRNADGEVVGLLACVESATPSG